MGETGSRAPSHQGEQATSISNLLVRVVAEFTGRGPTRARTHINEDVITVVLEDSLTKGERSLVRDGRADIVINMRRAFQRTMAPILIEGVEQITGRTVQAFLSDNHIDPDIAVETFVLQPLSPDGKYREPDAAPDAATPINGAPTNIAPDRPRPKDVA